ncbi:hypothetical protein KP509_26G033600 [Ceratopteris richardii]|uniref:Ultraviolet-B receptor UVR8 n=1 Tax=Ceratopteris richardii TaxID=49495 RepID=A0A8T2RMI6_CERRI|nr:hypothetical protein KP509_26G033600 [Ceratopteris richardii]
MAMDREIVKVTAGESHTLVLTGDGKVFAWGKGLFGRLGNGSTSDQLIPAKVELDLHMRTSSAETYDHEPVPVKIVSIAAGSYHSLALTDNGAVWSWGYNNYGQLGREGSDEALPHPLGDWGCCNKVTVSEHDDKLADAGGKVGSLKLQKVGFVEAGGMMSCAVDQDGLLWMWGYCPSFENKTNETSFSLTVLQAPQPMTCFQGFHVKKVACGNEHVLALVDDHLAGNHVCYAWGNNRYGQLGIGNCEAQVKPQLVAALNQETAGHLIGVSCGAYHSAVLMNSEMVQIPALSAVSKCWTFGMGENGQLGHGDSASSGTPKLVQGLPKDERIVEVSCGLFHTGVVSEGGAVWIWGMEKGLGLCPGLGPPGVGGGDYLLPVKVIGSDEFTASHGKILACGAGHTVLASVYNNESVLWAWGRGQNGLLGTGKSLDSVAPCKVCWPPCNYANLSIPGGGVGNDGHNSMPSDCSSETRSLQENSDRGFSEEMLAMAQKEICTLTAELSLMKRYYASLHAAVYGPSASNDASSTWEVLNDWDRRVAESSYEELVCLDDFYRQARGRIKDAMLQRKVKMYCEKFMHSIREEGFAMNENKDVL